MDEKNLLALIVDLQERVRILEAQKPTAIGAPIRNEFLLSGSPIADPFRLQTPPIVGTGICAQMTGPSSLTN